MRNLSNEDILFEYNENGAIGNVYIHGLGIDEPLALINGSVFNYYHADALDSILYVSDGQGNVIQGYLYDSYGNLLTGAIDQPYAYTGREWDKDIGLYYYRARYYDPEIGRFITQDPIGFAGGDLNLYGYVQQNPVNFMDSDGLWAQSVVAGGVAGTIVGGITIITELGKGASIYNAAVTASISGVTTAVSVGLTASGVGALYAGPAATATNAALQQLMYGNINVTSAIVNAAPPSVGGALLGNKVTGATLGVVSGFFSSPATIAGNTFFSSRPCSK